MPLQESDPDRGTDLSGSPPQCDGGDEKLKGCAATGCCALSATYPYNLDPFGTVRTRYVSGANCEYLKLE